jgi:4-aminobutyrate aminotransferase-like enzyme
MRRIEPGRRRRPFEAQQRMTGAQGSYVRDHMGDRYFDLTSGWNVVNAGWNNPTILADWQECLTTLPFSPAWCTNRYREELTEVLAEAVPGYRPVFSCTGSEAIDNALKIARLVTGRGGVASFGGCYHGSTCGASLANGDEMPHLAPLGWQHFRLQLPFPCDAASMREMERMIAEADNLGALVFETVLTNAGCHVMPNRFFPKIEELAREYGFLLICDEVGTGISRTGTLLSCQRYPVRPDLIVCGKALTNGLYPLSITFCNPRFLPLLDEASFASTYGGTSAGCAAALATLGFHRRNKLGAMAAAHGAAVRQRLLKNSAGLPSVRSVEGAGLELAIHLRWEECTGFTPDSLLDRLADSAIFAVLSPPDDHLMFMPPLTSELPDLLDAADRVCAIVCA